MFLTSIKRFLDCKQEYRKGATYWATRDPNKPSSPDFDLASIQAAKSSFDASQGFKHPLSLSIPRFKFFGEIRLERTHNAEVRAFERGKPRCRREADRAVFTKIITKQRRRAWKWAWAGACKYKKRMVRRAGIEPARPVRDKGF